MASYYKRYMDFWMSDPPETPDMDPKPEDVPPDFSPESEPAASTTLYPFPVKVIYTA